LSNGNTAVIPWKTFTETNNAGFAIQHRAPDADGWTERGFVQVAGTTTQLQSYRFLTDALLSGMHTSFSRRLTPTVRPI
jgi:hypothetical protein